VAIMEHTKRHGQKDQAGRVKRDSVGTYRQGRLRGGFDIYHRKRVRGLRTGRKMPEHLGQGESNAHGIY